MAGISRPLDHRKKNCVLMSSQCVIWDGPDIPCINLCHGDSIEKVVYELATELCRILELLNVSTLDLSCFFENGCGPTDVNQLLQFILNKLCELSEEIDELQEEPTTFNCALLSQCRVNVSCNDTPNLLPIYHPSEPNALTYFAQRICTILQNIQTIQNQITTINTQIANLQNQINNINTNITNLGFPAYAISSCTNLDALNAGVGSHPINTPGPLIAYVNAIGSQLCCLVQDVFGTTITNLCTFSPQIQQSECEVLNIENTTFTSILPAVVNIYQNILPELCQAYTAISVNLNNCCSGCSLLDRYTPLYMVTRVIRDGSNNLPSANEGIYAYQWLNNTEVPIGFTISSLNIIYRVFSGNPSVVSVPVSGSISTSLNYFNIQCPSNAGDSQFSASNVNKFTHESKVFLIFEQTLTNGTVDCVKRFTIELDCPACNCGYVESMFATEKALPQLRDNRY